MQPFRRGDIAIQVSTGRAVTAGPRLLAASLDLLVEGVHFYADVAPDALGAKSVAVNLSDLAAMGASPIDLSMHVQTPMPDSAAWLAAVEAGAAAFAARYAAPLTVSSEDAPLRRISVQVLGAIAAGQPLTRSGARPGELLVVTGTLGDAGGALELIRTGCYDGGNPHHAALRERLERPTPRLEAGCRARGLATAGLDISDGLAGDVAHLLRDGALGARIDTAKLPLSDALLASVPRAQAVRYALGAGDDYELCLCVSPERHEALIEAIAQSGISATVVGELTDSGRVDIVGAERGEGEQTLHGYQHFAPAERKP